MSMRSAPSSKDEIPNRVHQNRSVPHLQDVVQVSLIPTRPGTSEAHVTDSAGNFRKLFARYFRVRLPADTVIVQKAVQLGVFYVPSAQEIDSRFADDSDILARIEHGHSSHSLGEE